MTKYIDILNRFNQKNILVIGDLVLDQYITGSVSRISPEAPVPVVLQENSFYTPGGAANVGNNLTSLGCQVTLLGKIGDDIEGDILKKQLLERNINVDGAIVDKRVHTIFKTRIMAQQQQIVRLDRELIIEDDHDFQQDKVLPFVRKHIDKYDGIIISDYGKGMITPWLMEHVNILAKDKNIPVIVDPKVEHFHEYGMVTAITPNRKETETALKNIYPEKRKELGIISTKLRSKEEIESAGVGLLKYLNIESLLITLGEDGMYVFEKDQAPFAIETRAQEVFDVSGAGDTVISVFTLALVAGASKREAADIANHAAAVVVAKMGAVAVTPAELTKSIEAF